MFRPRIIPCLLLKNDGLVKTKKFTDPVYIGDPINAVKIFNDANADELIFLDISATPEKRKLNMNLLRRVSEEAFMPFSAGGGISSIQDVKEVFHSGAEKVILNTICYTSPDLIRQTAEIYGNQAVVVAIDVKNEGKEFALYSNCGTVRQPVSLIEHALKMQELGAGELFLNSIDRDGTQEGFETDSIELIAPKLEIPVIACGGAGSIEDMKEICLKAGASAAAAGSIFVFMGKKRAVLINYPDREEMIELFSP